MQLKFTLIFLSLTFLTFLKAECIDVESYLNHYTSASLKTYHQILSESPQAVQFVEDDKVYLHEDRIIFTELSLHSALLQSDNGEMLSLSLVFSDNLGYYIPISAQRVGDKLFKLHCNACEHEWSGGAFHISCPECGSYNVVTWLNPAK